MTTPNVPYNEPLARSPHPPKALSLGTYIALISALVASGFLLVFLASAFFSDPSAAMIVPETSTLTLTIASIIALIVGLVIQWRGAKIENVPLCLIGFYMISAVLGSLTAMILPLYDLNTITAAAGGTVLIAVCFGVFGFLFPNFFAKIHGLLVIGLLGMIVVEIAFLLLGVSQGWTDWVVLVIFCGFIGYDFYQAVHVPKTAVNAIIFATNIYLDLINVFLRLLSIFGNRD